jgi:hypothetical protein
MKQLGTKFFQNNLDNHFDGYITSMRFGVTQGGRENYQQLNHIKAEHFPVLQLQL